MNTHACTHIYTHTSGVFRCHLSDFAYPRELRHGTCHFYTIYTGISKISSVYGNLKDQMKLDLCICEALRYTSVPWKPQLWACYQLPLISIKPMFENISSKAEQKTTVARYQTCYTNSTQRSVHESI